MRKRLLISAGISSSITIAVLILIVEARKRPFDVAAAFGLIGILTFVFLFFFVGLYLFLDACNGMKESIAAQKEVGKILTKEPKKVIYTGIDNNAILAISKLLEKTDSYLTAQLHSKNKEWILVYLVYVDKENESTEKILIDRIYSV